jgi:hypothetical protein
VSTREQLDWEARWARPAAAAAFAAALLLIPATVLRQIALDGAADDDRKVLTAIDAHAGSFLASSVLQLLSFVAIAGVLYYLGRAVLARRPELPRALIWLSLIGPLLLGLAGLLSDLDRLDIADRFLSSGPQTADRAENLLEDRSVLSTSIGAAGTFALALAFVLFSINAIRVGLLTRFMGVIGAIVGALYIIPLGPGPVILLFWLLAIGVLFSGRWPGGRGPAWETGEAIEWPSGRIGAPAAEGDAGAQVSTTESPEAGNDVARAPSPARTSRKRKKKKR